MRAPVSKPALRECHDIIAKVGHQHLITVAEITGKSRLRPIVNARVEAIREVKRRMSRLSLTQLGTVFNRDHTTILHHIREK